MNRRTFIREIRDIRGQELFHYQPLVAGEVIAGLSLANSHHERQCSPHALRVRSLPFLNRLSHVRPLRPRAVGEADGELDGVVKDHMG